MAAIIPFLLTGCFKVYPYISTRHLDANNIFDSNVVEFWLRRMDVAYTRTILNGMSNQLISQLSNGALPDNHISYFGNMGVACEHSKQDIVTCNYTNWAAEFHLWENGCKCLTDCDRCETIKLGYKVDWIARIELDRQFIKAIAVCANGICSGREEM